MEVLFLSNQGMTDDIIGNPIMLRMRDTTLADPRIDDVKMLRCKKPFAVRKELRTLAKEVDVIHIHFGGLYALITWFLLLGINKLKFITFHGTDIHAKSIKTAKDWKEIIRIRMNQKASFMSIALFDRCGFVAQEMQDYLPKWMKRKYVDKFFIHQLGVDYSIFNLESKEIAQKKLNLSPGKYALFSDVHNTTIKRRDIAKAIVDVLGNEYCLLIMCGVQFNQVPLYLNACDFVLLTSDEEGSPNIIREALALNKPVFSVEVGDAAKQLDGLKNSAVISRDPKDAAEAIKQLLKVPYIDNTRDTKKNIIDFTFCNSRIIDLYNIK